MSVRCLEAATAFPVVKGRCRVCGTDKLEPYRQTTCSKACADRIKILCWPSEQRLRVQNRDHGVCDSCGCDTKKLKRIMRWARLGWLAEANVLESIGFGRCIGRVSFWDMDHRVPVSEGGGVTPDSTVDDVLANLRTLCLACHKDATKDLAGRRARG